MSQKNVSFIIDVPDNVDDQQLEEALKFFLDINGVISLDNPLSAGDLDQLNPSNLSIS